MNSKEALNLLIPKDIQTHIDFRNKYGSSIKGFICQDLDRLEKLEKENQELIKKTDCCMWHECNKISQENTKFKKAFEILKNKKVNLFHIWVFDDYEQYKEHYIFGEYHAEEDMLTEEEFNLLKGILNDEQ